jgi:hypothetical protein
VTIDLTDGGQDPPAVHRVSPGLRADLSRVVLEALVARGPDPRDRAAAVVAAVLPVLDFAWDEGHQAAGE